MCLLESNKKTHTHTFGGKVRVSNYSDREANTERERERDKYQKNQNIQNNKTYTFEITVENGELNDYSLHFAMFRLEHGHDCATI